MHSPLDQVVGIDHASRIFVASRHPKSFISLDNADHLLTDVADANYAAAMVAVWASRFLPPLRRIFRRSRVAEGVVSTETLAGTFQLKVRSGEHTLFADEPASVGGLGTGLSPYELVSAGLAACTVMTMRLYANRKGLSARTGEHDRAAREGAGHDATRPVHPHHCPRWAAGDDQRARILAIADRCPVDLSLIRGSDVQTELLSASQAADPARLA